MNKNRAFSLIEISVVILIVAILVAGVNYGYNLLQSSKLSAAQNLTNNSPVTTINNLVLWLEPTLPESFKNQDGSEDIEDGDSISAWVDANQTNYTKIAIEQSNPSYQPKYVKNSINSLPALRFDHTNDNQRLSKAGVMTGKKIETTYFVVLKWQDSHSVNGQIIGIGGNHSTGDKMEHYLYILPHDVENGNAVGGSFWNGPTLSNDGSLQSAANFMTKGKEVLLTFYYDPKTSISRLYFGKELLGTAQANISGYFYPGATTDIVIGNHEVAPRTIGADIAEIIIYDRALPDEEIDLIQTYLIKKFNLK